MTTQECKRLLSKLGFAIGVSPSLISERLLSKEDKHAMLNDEISEETLMVAIQAWVNAGMPNYANGDTARLKRFHDEGRNHIINLSQITY